MKVTILRGISGADETLTNETSQETHHDRMLAVKVQKNLSQYKNFRILIGPEGGWAPEEAEIISQDPRTTSVALGPLVLRAETAALYAVSVFQSVFFSGQPE
jgi:RsmE family RNA methyltransferase